MTHQLKYRTSQHIYSLCIPRLKFLRKAKTCFSSKSLLLGPTSNYRKNLKQGGLFFRRAPHSQKSDFFAVRPFRALYLKNYVEDIVPSRRRSRTGAPRTVCRVPRKSRAPFLRKGAPLEGLPAARGAGPLLHVWGEILIDDVFGLSL